MAEHEFHGGDSHLQADDHNWYPERTTPQGTQENGVDFQHEGRDANLRSIINWLLALSAMVAVVIVLLYGAFQLLLQREEASDQLPSPLWARQETPPEPRLIPNPHDAKPDVPLTGPVEYLQEYRTREDALLAEAKLIDPATGLSKLPEDVTGSVLQELNKGAAAFPPGMAPSSGHGDEESATDLYPSDMSGGTRFEDRLK